MLARSLTSRAGLLRSPAFTPKVVPGTRLDNRVRLASAVPPVRDEMDGAGRPGPVCGGMARRDIPPYSAAGRIAPTSSGGGRSCRPEPGARPEGDATLVSIAQVYLVCRLCERMLLFAFCLATRIRKVRGKALVLKKDSIALCLH